VKGFPEHTERFAYHTPPMAAGRRVQKFHTRAATNHAAKRPSFQWSTSASYLHVNDAAEAAMASMLRRVDAFEMAGGTLGRFKKATISAVAGFT
jgi:hypothetical protein